MTSKNGLPTTGSLVDNFMDSISGFLLETGNMVYCIERYKETGDDDKIAEAFLSGSLAIGHLGNLVAGPLGNQAQHTNMAVTVGRLGKHIIEFQRDWSNEEININLTQNILADGFSLLGMAMKNARLGVLFSVTGDAIGAIALSTGDTGKMPLEDFNAENMEGFVMENLQPLSNAIYDLFGEIDSGITTLLDNQDSQWINLVIDKLDTKRLDEINDNVVAQNAVLEQLHDWYYHKPTDNNDKFFTNNSDVLQYTTAAGAGFINTENQSDTYVRQFLTNLAEETHQSDVSLFFNQDYQQWNIVTNKQGGEAVAIDAEKTQMMIGNIGNDTLTGGHKNDIIIGLSGNDTLKGGDGNDYLSGGDGIDSLYGGKGADRLEGGKGFDLYHVDNGDTVFDEDGEGVIFFNGNKLGNFQQDEHNQSLWYEINNNGEQTGITATQQGNNLLIADGNENAITIENYFQAAQTLSGSYFGLNIRLNTQQEETEENEEPNFLLWQGDVRPNTKIIHKDGEDIDTGIYDVNWTDHSQRDENGFLINGEFQAGFNDVMVGQNGISNHIYGLGGNDALSGGNGDDVIDGGDGNDLITGGGGADTIYGGIGDDNIYSNLTLRVPFRNSDDDKWIPSKSYFNIVTTAPTWGTYTKDKQGNRTIDIEHKTLHTDAIGQMGDRLYGGSGNDEIIGGNRNDVIYGDELDSINTQSTKDGDDSLYGMGGDDLIYGNGGDDVIFGDGKADNASKGIFQYSAISEHGNDIIYSGSGDDGVYGNAGDDVIFGEDGDDYLWGDFANSADSQAFADVNGNDYIDGGLGNDQILGGGGDDYLMGDKGDDLIIGDYFTQELIEISGSDVIDGGDGNDRLIGGAGNDTLLGGNGNDKLWGDFDNTIGIDVVGNDYLDGGDGDDEIGGGAGDDVLIGGKGNDKLFGDFDIRPEFAHIVGNDYLDGGDGNDYLDGGNGDDILIAGKGSDELWGGAGNDLYLFNSEDLQDGQNNQIVDKDGKGNILIDNVYLHQHNWRAIAPNIWRTDTMQLRKIIQDEHTFLLWQSQQHTSTITVQDYQDGDLNINLPSFLMPENPTQPTVHSNHAPQISNSTDAQTIYINQNWTYKLPNLFTDPDGDTLTYHITNLLNWLTYDEQTHSLTGTASIDDIGTHTLNITATDPKGANVTSHFHLNITHPNIHNAQYLSGSQNGTMKADLLIGDEHNNIIRGLAGDDEIYGKDGEDQINGNNGNDRIDGGKGDDQLHGGNGNDTLIGGEGNDLLNGNAGNDILNGEDRDDLFYGGVGNDKLYGGKGNDRLWGGAGNDYLQGGLGNDTYIFDSNFGQDIINNHDTSKQRNDIIRFKDERSANDFTYIRQDQDLIILAKANDDQITVQNHFHEESEYRIDALHFQDGSILTNEDIANIIATNEQQTEDIDPEETETYHLEEIMPDWRYEDEEENDVWL